MQIIAAYDEQGNTLTQEQINKDLPKLREINQKALETEALWEYFGGTIDIEDRTYQVY